MFDSSWGDPVLDVRGGNPGVVVTWDNEGYANYDDPEEVRTRYVLRDGEVVAGDPSRRMYLDAVHELRVRNVVETMIRQETEKVPAVIPEAEARAYYGANPNIFESGGRPLPFEDVRERITFQLVTFKRQEALNTLLTRLRSAATIETFL